MFGSTRSLLRRRGGHEDAKVSELELFFDLVFVFATTQVSHTLLAHLSAWGALEAALLMAAMWWVWIFTSWVTNWLDPRHKPVQLMLLALMGIGLFFSTSIPDAFGDRGAVLALAYVGMQVGRSLFMLWALRGHDAGNHRNFLRITAWLATAGVFWIAGGFLAHHARFGLWALALAIEYAGPSAGFWTPGLGRSSTEDWDVDGAHMAERAGLFVIIALGEAILVAGATYAGLPTTPATLAAFAASFLGSAAMWWIYFRTVAACGTDEIAHAADPGRIARLVYTYIHLPIVAGVIVSAVADELVLAHPGGHAAPAALACIVAGPALFLLGTGLFRRFALGEATRPTGLGLAALVAVAGAGLVLPPLALAALTTAILLAVAWAEPTAEDHAAVAVEVA